MIDKPKKSITSAQQLIVVQVLNIKLIEKKKGGVGGNLHE